MKKTKVNLIGLGEIGMATFAAMVSKERYNGQYTMDALEFYATDVDNSKAAKCKELGAVKFSNKPFKKCDVYIISVWSTDQIVEVLEEIRQLNRGYKYIVSIESTLDPAAIDDLLINCPINETLAAFPHRYMANDPDHQIFNLKRVLGVYPRLQYPAVRDFYAHFLPYEDFIVEARSFEDAVLSKVLENAYRYMQIVLAQELSMALGSETFDRVRLLSNTKWNIGIREAKDGVGGKCLPKDFDLLMKYSEINTLNTFKIMNETYSALKKMNITYKSQGPQF